MLSLQFLQFLLAFSQVAFEVGQRAVSDFGCTLQFATSLGTLGFGFGFLGLLLDGSDPTDFLFLQIPVCL